ncbi:MAG TPA: right-handed parallel beta-helix repeat-containing protein [Solirubrobacteraceae bacterium]|jgi:nitrous oxidase accessory protein NosD
MLGRRKKWGLVLGAASVLAFAAPAGAATWTVDDDHVQCPLAQFTSIQAAVQAAAPNDTVQVCAGLYQETVTVDKAGLKLYSTPRQAAVIKAPAIIPTTTGAIVDVTATGVHLDRFTITGPGGGPCNSLRYGVFVGSGGSADVRDNRITQIRDNPFGGCQNGIGVRFGSQFLNSPGSGTLFGNYIDHYQKGGVVVDGAGSSVSVQQNRIQGAGPTDSIAQNGIQVSRGAAADVEQNIVLDNSFSGPPIASSTGILLFQSTAAVDVDQNEATRNDDNLAAYETTGAVIEHNDFWKSSLYDGIYMNDDTSDNLIRDNFLRDNTALDCEDNGANTWENNDGVTQNRPGLCAPHGGDKPGRQREPTRHVQPYL